jgi:hypothetical protein
MLVAYPATTEPSHECRRSNLHPRCVRHSPRRATLLPRWFELESAPITALLRALMTHLVRDQDDDSTTPGQGELVDAAQASLAAAGVDLTTAFAPDADFWRAHTQAGIASLLAEAKSPEGVSFADWYLRQHRQSATDAKAFERLLNGTLTDLIAALGQTAFDFSAWLPEVIARRFTTPAR